MSKKFDWVVLSNLGFLGIPGFFLHPRLKLFFFFFLLNLFPLIKALKQQGKELKNYRRTLLLSQLNPYLLLKSIFQLTGQLVIVIKYRGKLPNPSNYLNQADYTLPFKGEWLVANGGSDRENSHSWEILTQRYAYDFLKVDEKGNTRRQAGDRLEDYYCWGAEVFSPAEGTVVKVKDGLDDYQGVGDQSLDWKTKDFRGNFVIIRHSKKEYSFIGHLRKGSIRVKKGDPVKQGDVTGECGNTGFSTEPHIHFHLQDSKNFWTGMGLPIRFKAVEVQKENERRTIKRNDFIERFEIVNNCRN